MDSVSKMLRLPDNCCIFSDIPHHRSNSPKIRRLKAGSDELITYAVFGKYIKYLYIPKQQAKDLLPKREPSDLVVQL